MSTRQNGRRRPTGPEVSAEVQAELDAVYHSIISRAPEHDIDPTLDRVAQVCELLGDPQKAFRTIHITGTNGKTSTSRMTERLVREHGLRTGRFTSPHLTSVTERIAIDGEPLSAERFIEVWKDVQPYVEMVDTSSQAAGGPKLSFFEVLTVMAFAAFADAPVDVAIIEVGLGGLWDSTNVVDAEIAIIAPVALDHQQWLGETVEEIAAQKAGIVKDGATLVLAQQDPLAEDVIVEIASARGAHIVREGTDIEVAERFAAVGGQLMSLRTPAGLYTEIFMPVYGAHQAHNALLALTATEALVSGGGALDGDVVGAAFQGVDSPGRLEVVRRSPTILVDAAHNAAGARALVDAIEESFDFTRLVGVVGILADKDAETILSLLEPVLAEVVVTQSSSMRSHDVDDLEEIAVDIFGEDRVRSAGRLDEAIDVAAGRAESEDLIGVGTGTGVLVTGSVILAAEARTLLGLT
ncbi:bifunctional folylpolyglutamate synthase/dihydrofolate synthase [Sanguibacter inulinus]|uniref:tetrahydrofolate synthase n=1 Tax=Sanguibacter inulinus TaxID=60922 RepID=A0A853ETU7_9MICO|nr:folylpolyglutamate synthase/dihydrofolate synthase family protein [Sanguibacter inulinus]MBF0722029.1 bifunctional folylpolyglutamate synthase/dihydrofolate synthase [Sanguibacter inulinus]NYS93174.1 bifunctional folylpolyglutamate synthase/dihydrofolate synthase [Sanguibacter inulinus]